MSGRVEYKVTWVSPVTDKWLGTDGGWFESYDAAVKWARSLATRREVNGVSKGTMFEVSPGVEDREVLSFGSGS
jgi:hypothetical protein